MAPAITSILPFPERRLVGRGICSSPRKYRAVVARRSCDEFLRRCRTDHLAALLRRTEGRVRPDSRLIQSCGGHVRRRPPYYRVGQFSRIPARDQYPCVEADSRFIEDVQGADQLRSELVGKRNPLCLASRERPGLPIERQIPRPTRRRNPSLAVSCRRISGRSLAQRARGVRILTHAKALSI